MVSLKFFFFSIRVFFSKHALEFKPRIENTFAKSQIESYFLLHGNNFGKELTVNIVIESLF